ncbi:hypothetical protein ES703_19887 [subsurface metagenome]
MAIEHYQRQLGFNSIPVIHPAIFADDCSGSFNYEADGHGDDWVAQYHPDAALVQMNGIILQTRATEPAENDRVYLMKRLWLDPERLLRLQIVFKTPMAKPEMRITFALVWGDGEQNHHAGIHYESVDSHVDYVSGGNWGLWTYTELPDVIAAVRPEIWNKLDFDIDLTADTYHRLHTNQHARDMSEIPLVIEGGKFDRYLYFLVFLWATTAFQQTLYLDQVLLTPENG